MSFPLRKLRRMINDYRILTDKLYTVPTYNYIVLSAEKSKTLWSSENHYCNEFGVCCVYLDIIYAPQTAAVFAVYNLFATQIHYSTVHKNTSAHIWYERRGCLYYAFAFSSCFSINFLVIIFKIK